MKKILFSVLSAGILLLVVSCGGEQANLTSLDQMPKITAPVVTSGVSSSSVDVTAATTGLTFYTASSGNFIPTSSMGMCQLTNFSRELLSRASSADQILCYIQNTVTSAANAAVITAAGIDIYDGNYHYVKLNFGETNWGITQPVMKMKIVKTGNVITEFEMFMCMGGTNAAPEQTEYLHQVISGGNVTITSKNLEQQWNSHMSVEGTLNSNNEFTSKTITSVNSGSEGANTHAAKLTLQQYSDVMKFSGYEKGTWSDGSTSGTFSNRAYSEYQLINGTSSNLHTLAMGDGSVHANMGGTCTGCTPYSEEVTESWNGDTTLPLADATTGDYYTGTMAGTVPTTDPTTEANAIAFGTSETWDCATGIDANAPTIIVDQAALDIACAAYSLYAAEDWSWINCWDIMGNP